MIPSNVVGSVTGTGAGINIRLGFKPDYVLVENATTGASLGRFRGSDSRKTVVAGTVTVVSGSASLSDFEDANGEGFTIPVDAQVNVNGQKINYLAVRSGPGAK